MIEIESRRRAATTVWVVAFVLAVVAMGGRAAQAGTLLSQGRPATASSIEGAGYEAARAVDGNTATRWASVEPATTNQWIYVDLGTTAAIDRVVLNWEAAYARSYQIQVSSNASSWTGIYSTTSGDGGIDDRAVAGSGRYVRILCTRRGTAYGYSLWELQVYGTTGGGQAPYGGTVRAVPGTIQAEDYDTGGAGVAYQDTTAGNSGGQYRNDDVDIEATTDGGGGHNVGWTEAGEWLEYSVNVASAGAYTFEARVASLSTGGTLHLELDGANVSGTVTLPSTGGWQNWTTVSKAVTLSAGTRVLRLAFDSAGFNVNWIRLTGGTPGVCTTLPSVPSGLTSPGKTTSSVSLSWNASTPGPNCTVQYRVFRNGTQATQVSTTSATITGLTASTTYSFTVAAINEYGSSAQSSPISVTTNGTTPNPTEVFFDDFLYTGPSDANLTGFGWSARSGSGGPGNGTWSTSYISFVDGPVNKVLRLRATVSGSSIVQSELDYENERMLEGTYAARVWFTDTPDSGSDGDHIVEANLWSMSDWTATSGTANYSELDFEYLPNGGWGTTSAHMWNTTWERDDPASNQSTQTPGSFAGWRTLVMVVSGGQVKYYDGTRLLTTHGGIYYPESRMSILPQLWFTQVNTTNSSWHVDDDWVFYARNTVLTAQQVEDLVASYRSQGIARRNTLP